MTCIVGLTNGKRVWIGGDSAGVDSGRLYLRKEGKVWRVGEFVIGSSGSMRLGQILQHQLEPPPITGDLLQYMTTGFVDAVRNCLKTAGKLETDKGEECIEAHLLVGVRGRLFTLDGALGVMETPEPFTAIGCGASEAKGALWCMVGTNELHSDLFSIAGDILERALKCSERFNTDVRGPFHIVSTIWITE